MIQDCQNRPIGVTVSEWCQARKAIGKYVHTYNFDVVILHSIIKHRHPAIIRFCYWMIMQPKGGIFSPTQLHISVHYKKLRFLS